MEKIKLTGDPKADFPELFDNKFDNEDAFDTKDKIDAFFNQRQTENEYIKKTIIEEVIENVEVKEDLSVYDKRLRRPLLKRIFAAIFGNEYKI
jgi:hypothetical protein